MVLKINELIITENIVMEHANYVIVELSNGEHRVGREAHRVTRCIETVMLHHAYGLR